MSEFNCDVLLKVGRPGTIVSSEHTKGGHVDGSADIEYYGGYLVGESISDFNARRLVASWNACIRIQLDYLEKYDFTTFNHFLQVKAERDEAREELRLIREAIKARDGESTYDELLAMLGDLNDKIETLKTA